MHGSIGKWLARLLTSITTCGVAALAVGQQYDAPAMPSESGYVLAADSSLTAMPARNGYLVADNATPAEKDLAGKVKDLEAALKKITDKEKADKEKAAGAPSVKVGGFLFWDSMMFSQTAASRAALGDAQDTTMPTAARIGVEGDAFNVGFYKIELDFANRGDLTSSSTYSTAVVGSHTHGISGVDVPAFKDTYIGIKELPLVGKVFIGYFKEPVGLEELTSDKYQDFMTRSYTNALTPSRQIGIMAQNNWANENGTWSVGAFRKSSNSYPPYVSSDSGLLDGSARITYLPWYDEATYGRGLLHLGTSYTYRDFNNTNTRVCYRPEVTGAGPYVIDTRYTAANGTPTDLLTSVANEHLFGLEAAFVYGAFSVQSEFLGAQFNRTGANNDAYVNAAYIEMSYFLTGENRVYNKSNGTFARVRPFTNFFRVRTEDGSVQTGSGAWQLVYRCSWINANTAGIAGGAATDQTFGVNWYLNPNMKIMGDWVHCNDKTPYGAAIANTNTTIDILMLRAAVDY